MDRGRSAFLLLTVFLSGAAVMVVEMTTVRVLQPTFGSTTYVWTNVIAVVLAALAAGYAIGGRIADRRGTAGLLYGILAAGGLLVAATVPLATPVSKWVVPLDIDLENVSSFLSRGSLVATLILFAPSTLLLGMVSPIAIKLLADSGAGRAAGRVFAFSTVGSIVGTYLPTLWLIPECGSRGTLLVAAAMLIAPAVIGLIAFSGRRGAAVAAVAVAVWGATNALADTRPNRGAPHLREGGTSTVLDERESAYQYLTVRDDTYPGERPVTERFLTINEGVFTYHSAMVVGTWLTGHRYYDDYALLPLLLDVPAGGELRGAVVGLAGGITTRQWEHFWEGPFRLRVDGAEIDPEVIELGRKRFDMPGPDSKWLRAYALDGRQMLEAAPRDATYHMIVVDAFAQELYIPFHLGTVEFFRLCRRRLAPGGVFAMNVGAFAVDSPNLAALENTLATAFGRCQRVQQWWGGNYLLLARNAAEPADVTRLAPSRIAQRMGARPAVAEWDQLVRHAEWIPMHTAVVLPDARKTVLTDDHCPLENLTDRLVADEEARLLGR